MTLEELPAAVLTVLIRVSRGQALSNADREAVLSLVSGGFMHSNPVHIPGEVCPYRLTDRGRAALKARR